MNWSNDSKVDKRSWSLSIPMVSWKLWPKLKTPSTLSFQKVRRHRTKLHLLVGTVSYAEYLVQPLNESKLMNCTSQSFYCVTLVFTEDIDLLNPVWISLYGKWWIQFWKTSVVECYKQVVTLNINMSKYNSDSIRNENKTLFNPLFL